MPCKNTISLSLFNLLTLAAIASTGGHDRIVMQAYKGGSFPRKLLQEVYLFESRFMRQVGSPGYDLH